MTAHRAVFVAGSMQVVDRVSFAGEPDLLAQPHGLGLVRGEIGLELLGLCVQLPRQARASAISPGDKRVLY